MISIIQTILCGIILYNRGIIYVEFLKKKQNCEEETTYDDIDKAIKEITKAKEINDEEGSDIDQKIEF